MKVGGVIRTIDKLGRVVIPKSMCKALNIQAEDELDITVEGERIILKKYENGCIFCNRTEGLVSCNGKHGCARCHSALKEME